MSGKKMFLLVLINNICINSIIYVGEDLFYRLSAIISFLMSIEILHNQPSILVQKMKFQTSFQKSRSNDYPEAKKRRRGAAGGNKKQKNFC